MGGCSSHNACALVRGEPIDYDERGEGWTYVELEPHFERAEQELRAHWIGREELSPWHRAFADAGVDATLPHPFNLVATVRWNAAFAYLDPARQRPNLTILADTLVDRVLLDGERATGVATASRSEIRASTVVLTAGAYGTPAILLRSRIGPDRGLPVGEGLADHVGVGAAWEPTPHCLEEIAVFEAQHPLFMAAVTIRAKSSRCDEGSCDLFVFPALDPGPEISCAVFAMKPCSRGSVRLTSLDPEAPLAIDHGFLREPADADVLAEGFEQLRALVRSEPLEAYAGREVRPGAEVAAPDHVRASARGFFHPTGTCAIGRVVDDRGRVLGYEGLVVADASIMPTIPRANTHLTVIAVAELLAEILSKAS